MVEDYIQKELSNGVAFLYLNQKDAKVNIVSPTLINVFEQVIDAVIADDSVKAAVFISAKKDFIAGADIQSFSADKIGDFQPISLKGHALLAKLENSPKPFVAAIHGTAYGLGVELPLACAARVASVHKSTKLALPEVKLGLLPGGGGTQRLPRLIGLQASLDMMLTGKNIFASKAKKIGLVDELVHPSKLKIAAEKLALRLVNKPLKRKRKITVVNKFLDHTSIGRSIVYKEARKKVLRQTLGNYPAPMEIINCVETGLQKGTEAGYQAEVLKFEELMMGSVSKELRNLFFAMSDKKKNRWKEHCQDLRTLGLLGAGFMGSGIAEVTLDKGIDIVLKDLSPATIQTAKKTLWKALSKQVKRKSLSKVEAKNAIAAVKGQVDYKDFETIDVLVEAVFEDMAMKQKILAEVEQFTKEDFIFATNTSALSIKEIGKFAKHPENVIGLHYFSPVSKMPLLEIVKTPSTSLSTIATCYDLGLKQGKTCIVVNDGPGFYVNRILAPYLNEAMLMLEEGADIIEIDNIMKQYGFPVGPFALMDEVGIDVGAHVMTGDLAEMFKKRDGALMSKGLLLMNDAGCKGRKNKRGFLAYDSNGKKIRGKFNPAIGPFFGNPMPKKFKANEVQLRLSLLLLNEAVLCLQEGIIESVKDGDLGAIFGIGFRPFTGGPFRYIDQVGAANILKELDECRNTFGERFKACDLLIEYAKSNKTFY
jgi:3-hydroxyacyl-CoA dehydrogenase/enoyl-CoA hydratase/3-hydroxybutyryl-CoA epimerase